MATGANPPNPPIVEDIGDYVDLEDEYDVVGGSEPRSRYIWDDKILSRFYCPIRIGEVLNQQYRIEHKVGWGGFSTVWLARDLQTNLLVNLKVLCNSPHAEAEHQIHHDIIERGGSDISEYLVVLKTAFHLRNPDRVPLSPRYRVLVLPVRGPSLQTACFKVKPAERIFAARHLLMAVKRLHDAGIIHTG
jgi:serine/threonine protein kinase